MVLEDDLFAEDDYRITLDAMSASGSSKDNMIWLACSMDKHVRCDPYVQS